MSKQLVFIGDSLTQWYGWQRRFPQHAVTNLGIAGERVEELFARLPDIHVEAKKPDYLLLMTGINNIGARDYDIIETYHRIVNDLAMQYQRSTLVLQSILPIILNGIEGNYIQGINLQINEMAREFNAVYLDIHTLFLDAHGNPKSEYLQDDGVHLSSKGYDVWANEVERFLKSQEKA